MSLEVRDSASVERDGKLRTGFPRRLNKTQNKDSLPYDTDFGAF